MAYDMNPTPTGYGNQMPVQSGMAPAQNNPVTTPMGGVGQMVQALMGGYNKYLNGQAQPGAAPAAATPGAPMQIHPGMDASLGNNGAFDANGNMVQALFNPNQPSGLY